MHRREIDLRAFVEETAAGPRAYIELRDALTGNTFRVDAVAQWSNIGQAEVEAGNSSQERTLEPAPAPKLEGLPT